MPYHQQDIDDYCGVAVAQMMLERLGKGTLSQHDLYDHGLFSLDANGGTPPAALQKMLHKHWPDAAFSVHCDCKEAATQRIAATLATTKIGVPAIVKGNTHWIIVAAVEIDGNPADGPPFAIKGFYINDPEPRTASILYPKSFKPPPLPHSADDVCGHGYQRGTRYEYVSRSYWDASYWATENPDCGGFVTISNGPQPSLRLLQRSASGTAGKVSSPFEPTLAKVRGAVASGINTHNLDRQGRADGETRPLAKRIAHYSLGDVSLVTQLDVEDGRIYQVQMNRGKTQVGTGCIDGVSGEFMGIRAPAGFAATQSEIEERVQRALRVHAVRLRDVISAFEIERALFTIHPTLVWRACRQSMSPYYPFIQVNVAGAVLYVAVDGRVHRRLEPHGPG